MRCELDRAAGDIVARNASAWTPAQSSQMAISGGGTLASLLSSGSTPTQMAFAAAEPLLWAPGLGQSARTRSAPWAADGADCLQLCPGGPGPAAAAACLIHSFQNPLSAPHHLESKQNHQTTKQNNIL